jgi:hypothetical protein
MGAWPARVRVYHGGGPCQQARRPGSQRGHGGRGAKEAASQRFEKLDGEAGGGRGARGERQAQAPSEDSHPRPPAIRGARSRQRAAQAPGVRTPGAAAASRVPPLAAAAFARPPSLRTYINACPAIV